MSDTGPKPKRRPGGGFDDRASDDSDFDDLRQIGGFRRGMQSASAKSVCAHSSLAAHSMTNRWLMGLQDAAITHRYALCMQLRHEDTLAGCPQVALANTKATKAKTARTSRTGAGSMADQSSVGGRNKDGATGRSHSGDRSVLPIPPLMPHLPLNGLGNGTRLPSEHPHAASLVRL